MTDLHQVPPFLHLASTNLDSTSAGFYSGVIHHKILETNVDAHARWWPCLNSQVRTIALFIPGNPGLLDFYTPFLSALHHKSRDDGLAILGQAHLGHSPHIDFLKSIHLFNQVEAAIETFDAIKTRWPDATVILIGHSVGSWIATQILKARPDSLNALFMLFPTISHLSKTPNGKRLSWLFRTPFPSVISRLSVLIRPVSAPILSFLFPSWPAHQKTVLRSLLCSPRSIYATLTMAHDEMHTITNPDVSLLQQHSPKLWFYYADKDAWVGDERDRITQILGDEATIRVVHCKHGIPHAFCILHGDQIAAQCAEWLKQGGWCEGKGSVDR